MPHATIVTGFQAFILCGPGESLNPFNSNPTDFPKALVPIANRPMVWYPLEWCYRMGVTNINLITPYECRSALEAALSQNPHLTSLPSPRPNVIAPEDLTLTTGTAEIFRFQKVQDAVSGDFIVLPCDFVCEMNGLSLLEAWMTLQGGLNSQIGPGPRKELASERTGRRGGLGVWFQTKDSAEDGVGVKKEETDFLALTDLHPPAVPPSKDSLRRHVYNVAMSMPKATVQDELEERQHFSMRHALLRNRGKVSIKMTYRDAHVYFFPYWVKEVMKRNETFESMNEDLVGLWAKAGWQTGLAEKLGFGDVLYQDREIEPLEDNERNGHVDIQRLSSTSTREPSLPAKESAFQRDSFNFASRVHDAPRPSSYSKEQINVPPILGYCHPAQPLAPLLRRVDTVALLLSTSLSLAKLASSSEANAAGSKPSPFAHTNKVSPSTSIPPQLTIHQPSVLIDANVTLTPKSTIRDSVIGANCTLGSPGTTGAGVRLHRCLVMDGAVVESGSALNGCVLGRRSKVGSDCDLRDCYVQEGYMVPQGTTARGEVFAGFDEGGEEADDELYTEGEGADDVAGDEDDDNAEDGEL